EKVVKSDKAALDAVDIPLGVAFMEEVLVRRELTQRLARENSLHAALRRGVTVWTGDGRRGGSGEFSACEHSGLQFVDFVPSPGDHCWVTGICRVRIKL